MSKSPYIGNYKDFIEPDNNSYANSDELLAINSPIGEKLGLLKMGIHIMIIPPGRRTSWPHAESAEEEFVYVIEGNPSVWMDGHLHDLKPGDLVAWPSGTGICHTVMNNTKVDCLIMVGGEKNIPGSKIYYALHAKQNEVRKARGDLWEDWPKREMGPHDGIPKK